MPLISVCFVRFVQDVEYDPLAETVSEDDDLVKTEPKVIEEDFPFDENATATDIEETNPQFALDQEDIDHEVLNVVMEFKCVSFENCQFKIH